MRLTVPRPPRGAAGTDREGNGLREELTPGHTEPGLLCNRIAACATIPAQAPLKPKGGEPGSRILQRKAEADPPPPGALIALPGATSTYTCGANHPTGAAPRPRPGSTCRRRRPSARGDKALKWSKRGPAGQSRTPASPPRASPTPLPHSAEGPGARGRREEFGGAAGPGGRAAQPPPLGPRTLPP